MDWDWEQSLKNVNKIAETLREDVGPIRQELIHAATSGRSVKDIDEIVQRIRQVELRAERSGATMRDAWIANGPMVDAQTVQSALEIESVSSGEGNDDDRNVEKKYRSRTHLPDSDWARRAWLAAYSSGVVERSVPRARFKAAILAQVDEGSQNRALKLMGSGFRFGVWVPMTTLRSKNYEVTYRLSDQSPVVLLRAIHAAQKASAKYGRNMTYQNIFEFLPTATTANERANFSDILSWLAALGVVVRFKIGFYRLSENVFRLWPWDRASTQRDLRQLEVA